MKRRIFIQNAALAGLGVSLAGLNGCSTPNQEKASDSTTGANSPLFSLSLAQWSIHKMIMEDGLEPLEFASKARQWGFEGLEYVNHLYQSELLKNDNLNFSIQNLVKNLNQRSEDNEMKNLIMMVDLPPEEGDMAVTDKLAREKAIELHYPWVDATAGLGCHSMRVNMFGEFDAEKWKTSAIDGLSRLGEYAAKSNVNIIIENHGWLTSNAELLMEVINEVNLDNCGTLPDFGNFCTKRKDKSRWGECEEEYDRYLGVEQLMPAAKAVSAKSYDFDENGNETTIDYRRMLQIVKNAGYSGYIGVEYEGSRLSEEEGILATKNLLLKLGSEIA